MRIQYFGTAAAEGCPALFCRCELCRKARAEGGKNVRTRSQALVDGELLVDFPPDTYHHFLTTPEFDLPAIRNVIITHSHCDHYAPLELGLRCADYAGGLDGSLNVYGNSDVEAKWEAAVKEEYDNSPDLPRWVAFHRPVPYVEFQAGRHLVTALPADHKRNEECYIYLISDGQKTLLYANDTGISLAPAVWDALKGRRLDAVSMDCTAMDRRVGRNHMGLPDNADLKAKLLELGCADESTRFVVTHFSHFGALDHDELAVRAAALGFETAYDGFTLEF